MPLLIIGACFFVYVFSLQDYKTFWMGFGRHLKLGCIEDPAKHDRLAPLLRFNSSKNEDEMISLDWYVKNMKEGQKAIYYLAAETIQSAKRAPFLEEILKRDLEVGGRSYPALSFGRNFIFNGLIAAFHVEHFLSRLVKLVTSSMPWLFVNIFQRTLTRV